MALYRTHIMVDVSSPIYRNSARSIMSELMDEIKRHGLDREIKVVETGNIGVNSYGPSVVVYPEGVVYTNLSTNDAEEMVVEHLLRGMPVKRLLHKGQVPSSMEKRAYPRNPEMRIVLGNIGIIDPGSIEEYIAMGGYEAAIKAITQMTPLDAIGEINKSGLMGRSGRGISTGDKWNQVRMAHVSSKAILCNAVAAEPGNFKDSVILSGDPHSIIEGMLIAAYATGAQNGHVCIDESCGKNSEYIRRAISAARDMGLLGTDILGTGMQFDIDIFEGTGDFVCSDDSALLESFKGRRGEPISNGLDNNSTLIHGIETLANIPKIISRGADWFSEIGTELSKGTKVYCLSGDIVRPGIYEAPFGATLRDIVYNLAGGISNGKHLKAVLMGGPAGELVGRDDLDRQLCSEDLSSGSGALIVMDEDKCAVDFLKNIACFFTKESCGLCTPCRAGTKRIMDILTWCASGAGCEDDLRWLKTLAQTLDMTSKCEIGRCSSKALMSGLILFENDFISHVKNKVCPTGICGMDKILDEVC